VASREARRRSKPKVAGFGNRLAGGGDFWNRRAGGSGFGNPRTGNGLGNERGPALVDLERGDLPVGFPVRSRVRGNEVDAALPFTCEIAERTARLGVHATSPVAAECDVEDDPLLVEVLGHVAGAIEEGSGDPEGRHIRTALDDGRGNFAAREDPDRNVIGGQLHGVHPATGIVKGGSEGARAGVDSAADLVSAPTALGTNQGAVHLAGSDIAGATSVQDDLAVRHLVDTLDDVDFAVVRPVGAIGPEGRPRATSAAGHVLQVEDKQTGLVRLLALDAHGITARAVRAEGGGPVNAHVDVAVGENVDEASALGGCLIDVVHKAVGRIGS
jgi:hypothetical protein